ncbi:MAG: glucose-6-phosphate dehydrogenase [Rhodospirillaceae bacterium]|nr:glucose-6-phosphate dehydrogenase [Rhodospirillaceae bacterium]
MTTPLDRSSPASRAEAQPRAETAIPAPPCLLVIFGGTGDLTRRLLMPALLNLRRAGLLSGDFAVLGLGRTRLGDEEYRRVTAEAVQKLAGVGAASAEWAWLAERLHHLAGDFNDPASYRSLAQAIARHGPDGGRNVLFYLATPPEAFEPAIRGLAAAGLMRQDKGWRRVVVEKPFGTDVASAVALNRSILSVLGEDQVYRIDHYLGKETVQNIMVLRFSNGIFEPLWNRDHIDHVQISVAETVGVERRGAFYDRVGALRDMVPNHLFQLLSLTAMEVPVSFDADAVRSERVKVLEAVRDFGEADCLANVVRAQYEAGHLDFQPVPGYRDEPDVAPDSTTETFVALKLMIDNWRWAGVPFYLRTGKRLARRSSQIAIQFKRAPLSLFRDLPQGETMVRNFLVLQLQPDEGISLRFGIKVPGQRMRIAETEMSFRYKDRFEMPHGTGYETLIYDAMIGDAALFQRADFIEGAWRILQPILDAWRARPAEGLERYPAGSWGPAAAERLLAGDERRWCPAC